MTYLRIQRRQPRPQQTVATTRLTVKWNNGIYQVIDTFKMRVVFTHRLKHEAETWAAQAPNA